MVFSSITFLYYFLPLVVIIYFISPRKLKNFILLFASLVFYGCQSKSSLTSSQAKTKPQTSTVTASPSTDTKENVTSNIPDITEESTAAINQPNPIQKALADEKLNTTINSINSSLDTLDDVKDIDLNSVD